MKNLLYLFVLLAFTSCSLLKPAGSKNQKVVQAQIDTDSGTIIVKLYNQTPLHRDNFIKLIKQGFYDSLLFHRVINDFMIQGGDPNSKNAAPGTELGNGGLKYTIPAEFDTSLFHKRGALAMAREGDDVNPKKASSSTQFYIVDGKPFNDEDLDKVESRFKITIPENHRAVYRTLGGAPFLDMNYTVFGEVVSGMDVVDKIAAAATDDNDRPLHNIKMKITILKQRR